MLKLELEVKTKEEAEKLIKQLQEFVEEKEESLYPNIEKGKMFYIISDKEEVVGLNYYIRIEEFDKKDLANIYATREIAQKALDFKKSRRVWNFIENWAMHNSTFKPDWSDVGQYKYRVCYSNSSSTWIRNNNVISNGGVVYFSEKESDILLEILNSSDEYKL